MTVSDLIATLLEALREGNEVYPHSEVLLSDGSPIRLGIQQHAVFIEATDDSE